MNPLPFYRPLLTTLATLAFTSIALAANPELKLDGNWRFALDRANVGQAEGWFQQKLAGKIRLPGSVSQQGLGDPVTVDTPWIGGIVDRSWFTASEYARYRQPGHIKVPFWLQPETYYRGAAWYQRDIEVPAQWAGKRLQLTLERPHWETRVWMDGAPIGTNDSLSTPHVYDLGTRVKPGKHVITIRVDNQMVVDVGENSHSVSDHTQGNWNGLVGQLRLEATPPVWISDLQIHPVIATHSAIVKGRISNATGTNGQGQLTLLAEALYPVGFRFPTVAVKVQWDAAGGAFEATYPLGTNSLLWDEFNPALHRLTARLGAAEKASVFGLREITTAGTQFLLNGRKTILRGTLECAIFPRTGHPPTGVEEWKRILNTARDHGLNHLRFHSWCPPEAAFEAADEMGFYYQVECGSWANMSTTIGDGKPIDEWIYREADRILQAYGNHPSFVLMPYGNEPGGKKHGAFLARWVDHYKTNDTRRLYTSAAGWPQLKENQFHVTPDPRVQAWGEGLRSRINGRPPETVTDYRNYIQKRTVPVISHEIGQWCVYPNLEEISKYTGYLKARNFEIFRDTLAANGMLPLARQFLLASGKLQALCYKEDIESALRTPGMGGFQLLDLHDFPGQGTALVGVLDPFWESKGYVSGAEYSRFCNATVPLARLPKRVFTTAETLTATLEVAHFGAAPLPNAVLTWKLVGANGKPVASGKLPPRTIAVDNGITLGDLTIPLAQIPAPQKYRLVASLERYHVENDWDVWVYPAQVETVVPEDLLVVNSLTEEAERKLALGGKVILLAPPGRVAHDHRGKIAFGFSSIFWNTAWTHQQPPHTLGILCEPQAPAMAAFPTEYHSNWQWWYLVNRAQPMNLQGLPEGLSPVVRVIDDWVTNRRLGLVIEGQVGPGRLLVCSIDLQNDLPNNPVARQLWHSLVSYVDSRNFAPRTPMTPTQVRGLLSTPTGMEALGLRAVRASSAQNGYEASQASDGNPATLWHTVWGEQGPAFPHELELEFVRPITMAAVELTPRQDGQRNGWIKDYRLEASLDGKAWSTVATGSLPARSAATRIPLPPNITARFLRLVVLSGHSGQWASLAEINVLTTP
jgi:hypothetical protein